MKKVSLLASFFLTFLGLPLFAASEKPLPPETIQFITKYCFDCHEEDVEDGDINLEISQVNWQDPKSLKLWAKVHKMLKKGEMPPEDELAPSEEEREAILQWLDETLIEHSLPGGTVLQRLNRREYENSISALLNAPFKAPASFPADSNGHHFDTISDSLILSPPLMEQYFEIAGQVADRLVPPVEKEFKTSPRTIQIPSKEFSYSEDAGAFAEDDSYRLYSSRDQVNGSTTWPVRFESKVNGEYAVTIQVKCFQKETSRYPQRTESYKVGLYARKNDSILFSPISSMRKLATFELGSEHNTREQFKTTVTLKRGETIAIRWENSPMNSAPGQGGFSRDSLLFWLNDKRLLAAYNKVGLRNGLSASAHHSLVMEALTSKDLDIDDPELQDIDEHFSNNLKSVQLWKFAKRDMMLKGPALDILNATVHGPLRLIHDKHSLPPDQQLARFLGERNGQNDHDYAASILKRFLNEAFRRPCPDELISNYVHIARTHQKAGHSFNDGIHLAVRAALCSPHFLYRGHRDGPMDSYDLATRLSFFLTSSPPDAELLDLAESDTLSDPNILEQQARRLLADEKNSQFIESFTGQWLDLDKLRYLVPDGRLLRWRRQHLSAITAETHMFVSEILEKNLSLNTFIDSDFTYMNRWNAMLYGIEGIETGEMTRLTLPADKPRGGILTQPSILMATANGVDTQPVLRGAWLLENIFGDPTPPPPDDVPAIEPDISGANTIRELLDKHKADPGCASCHRKIDPPGFALENFDPIGRWRSHYPVYISDEGKRKQVNGTKIDASGTMTDGTALAGIEDLKHYLLSNIDQFSHCLTEKLLSYATGREPSYGDRKQINQIVSEVRQKGNGFQDLIIAVVLSDSFKIK